MILKDTIKKAKLKYKFSVVMPIYNVEKYIEEAIKSIINQDIGFEENIQIVLVNDGSTDNSEKICLKYKALYPNNIIYVKQENAGVSAARNKGTMYTEGKYINYLDPDDKWKKDVFSKVYKMFEENIDIDVIGVRQKFFDAQTNYHYLDYKFKCNKIVNIFEEFDYIQLSVTSAFIRKEAIKDKEFDKNLKYGEDVKFLTEIILEKEKYGLIADTIHYYRKRYENNSALQVSKENISWYLDSSKFLLEYLCTLSVKKYGYIIKYIQFIVMYDMQWRIFSPISNNLKVREKKEYIDTISKLVKFIDDNIILMQKSLLEEQKIHCLNLKYGKDVRKEFKNRKGKIFFKNIFLGNLAHRMFVEIKSIEIENNIMTLEGKLRDYYPEEDYEIYVQDNNGKATKIKKYEMYHWDKYDFKDECYFKGIGFKVSIPIKNIKSLKIMILYKNKYTKKITLAFARTAGLNDKIDKLYLEKNKHIIICKDNEININPKTKIKNIKLEIKYLRYLVKNKKIRTILYRLVYYILNQIKNKPIWLISDKVYSAGDNGEHIFKYLVKYEKNANIYFVIDKRSKDYKRMKKIGKVASTHTIKHKVLFLLSDLIMSSNIEDTTILNPFKGKETLLRDLYNFKFIFLQDNVTLKGMSNIFNRLNTNISLYITTSKIEYDYIIKGNYGYSGKEIKLTGFPRFDALRDNKKKQIVFMPTWRKNISGTENKITGKRQYNDVFKETDYYNFYNNLINDERLLKTMKKYGYTGKFCIHPCFVEQTIDFKSNELIEVCKEFDYQKEFAENALLITDFSSVAFDFAYLRKPIIYTQFDAETFFNIQLYDKGYYKYKKDGFGPICYNYEDSVNKIIEYIMNDCKVEKKYLNRINEFFQYNDKNNCKRVHEEILKL